MMQCEECGERRIHEYHNGYVLVVVDLICWRRDLLKYLCSRCHYSLLRQHSPTGLQRRLRVRMR